MHQIERNAVDMDPVNIESTHIQLFREIQIKLFY